MHQNKYLSENYNINKIYYIDIEQIDDFSNHPYKVEYNNELLELSESIRKFGVIVPAIVRKKKSRYEMIAGHRRKAACILSEIYQIPCIVLELSDEDAIITIVDSNIQRENILPSEKAFAYKLRLEAIKRKAGRPKKNSVPISQEFYKKVSRQILGEQVGESQDQIRRYIRLTELIKPILDMVDERKIALRPAVEISYLSKDIQYMLLDLMKMNDCTPNHSQTIRFRRMEENNTLNYETMKRVLSEEKGNQKDQFRIPIERIKKFFSPGTSNKKMEEIILEALELYNKENKII